MSSCSATTPGSVLQLRFRGLGSIRRRWRKLVLVNISDVVKAMRRAREIEVIEGNALALVIGGGEDRCGVSGALSSLSTRRFSLSGRLSSVSKYWMVSSIVNPSERGSLPWRVKNEFTYYERGSTQANRASRSALDERWPSCRRCRIARCI